MRDFIEIKNCRLCKSSLLAPATISLGEMPLANNCLFEPIVQKTYPLNIKMCQNCGHYQLDISVNPDKIFKNYLYTAGVSPVNVEHFRKYALHMVEKFNLKEDDLIIDIACNDNTLLKEFKKLGFKKLIGIDPAKNIIEAYQEDGIKNISDFFNHDIADKILKEDGYAKLICANNVMAHLDNFDEIIGGISKLIKLDGFFVFEVSYFKDVVDKLLFDTIYHEHTSYHLISVLNKYFNNQSKLTLIDVEKINTHGGSIRCFVKAYIPEQFRSAEVNNSVKFYMDEELDNGYLIRCYIENYFENFSNTDSSLEKKAQIRYELPIKVENFKERILKLRNDIIKLCKDYKKRNKKIAIYGVPAKAITTIFALGLEEFIDFAVDDSIHKIGRYIPNTNIKNL